MAMGKPSLSRHNQIFMKKLFFVLTAALSLGQAVAAQQIQLIWNPSATTNVVGYIIYRAVNGSPWISIGTTAATNFVTVLATGTNSYYVTATNALGIESVPSNMVGANGESAPSGLVLTYTKSSNMMTITWNPNPAAEGVLSYNVYEVVGGTNFTKLANVTTTTYSMAKQNGTHFYCLTALNGDGESPFSAVVSYADVLPPGQLKKLTYP